VSVWEEGDWRLHQWPPLPYRTRVEILNPGWEPVCAFPTRQALPIPSGGIPHPSPNRYHLLRISWEPWEGRIEHPLLPHGEPLRSGPASHPSIGDRWSERYPLLIGEPSELNPWPHSRRRRPRHSFLGQSAYHILGTGTPSSDSIELNIHWLNKCRRSSLLGCLRTGEDLHPNPKIRHHIP
jgi:hypothetical protein